VVKIAIVCNGNDGREAVNVFHQAYGGGPPSFSDCETIGQAWYNQWVAELTPTQPAQTNLISVTVTDLSSSTGAEGIYNNAGTPTPGTSAHGMLPLHSCFVLSKTILRRYRGGHPRMYLPIGTTNDLNDDGHWKGSSWVPWVAAWATMVSNVIAENPFGGTSVAEECCVSYNGKYDLPNSGPPTYRRVTPAVFDIPLDGYAGSEILGTQRRRVRRYR
jgi:hypothetical protein